ncbi:uncharacterized protein LOC106669045 isoform X1 [Cimex lectularius]|uniref:Uncharacterized protein n=1 Tax=Cimex lectularius TaxID=79782 RepID=A0A8I6RWS2_CIMLE|nr:uncharacterized protein LOC106669045 isoform X1 [Cimex lectularius]
MYLFKGKLYITLSAVFFALFLAVLGQKETKVAIVNSTSIENVKMHIPPEERSGSVMYVYARTGSVDLPYPAAKSEHAKPLDSMVSANGTELHESVNKTETDQEMVHLENMVSVNGTELHESLNNTENDLETVYLESMNSTTENSTSTYEKYCVVRVEEDETIKYYEGTMDELRDMGKNVLDLLCEGDSGPELKAVSRGALASLVGG